MKRRVLHLVREGDPVAGSEPERMGAVADRDWIVYLAGGLELAARGHPPLPPGSIDHDQLVALVFAADLVVTW